MMMMERFLAEAKKLLSMPERRKLKKENKKIVNAEVGSVETVNNASSGGAAGEKAADDFALGGNDV